MNILFVNYGDFTTNSLNHIGGFANVLSGQGHACIVAVPAKKESIDAIADPLFTPATFDEVLSGEVRFLDGRPADLIHAWTPRECVRRFVVAYQQKAPTPSRLVVHLEDNEGHLFEGYTGLKLDTLADQPAATLSRWLVDGMPDPLRYRAFLGLADGITVITPRLTELVPAGVPTHELPPGVDFDFYGPQPADAKLRAELGLKPGEKVVTLTGSNTFANEAEIRELYLAVALLNERGTPTRLIRTGFNSPQFLATIPANVAAHVLDLGFVAKAKLPHLLALADVLVQPGRPGPFNDYRLPSKLPEFLASGRPVILPPTNLALAMTDGREALFLDAATPAEIADLCEKVFRNEKLAESLGRAGHAFARQHFDLPTNTAGLATFYQTVTTAPPNAYWPLVSGTGGSDLALLPHLLARGLNEAPDSDETTALAENFSLLIRRLETEYETLRAAAAAAEKLRPATEQHIANLTKALAAAEEQNRTTKTLTEQHIANLTKALAAAEEQKRTTKTLTEQHIANLEKSIAGERAALQATAELTRQHVANLEKAIADERAALHAAAKLTQQHVANLERNLEAAQHALRESEVRAASATSKLSEVEKWGREQAAHLAQTRLHLTEVERIARERVEKAVQKADQLTDQLAQANAIIRTRDLKIARMAKSFSWQATSPLRALRRWMIDPFTVEKLPEPPPPPPAAAPASATKPAAPTPEPAPTPAPVAPKPAAPAAPAAPTYGYTYNFDHPRNWRTSSNKLLILGWCYENSGAKISGIRAHFLGQTVEGIYGSKRLDVMASVGGLKQAEYCGIKLELKTALGEHPLVIEVEHETGWHKYYETTVNVGAPGDPAEQSEYEKWCEQHEARTDDDNAAIADHIARFAKRPLISVIMPTYNPPDDLLEKAIASVRKQLYPHWELCVADDCSTDPKVREVLEKAAAEDERIIVKFREKNGHISLASNTAINLATGEYLALFDHDDVLAPTALYEIAAELDAHPDAALIYTDEDKIDGEDRRFDPYFKPDWNPDLLFAQNYTSHLSVFRADLVREIGGFRKGLEGSQDWDLTLRFIEQIEPAQIRHIPRVLYHWRAVPGSTALQLSEKSYPVDAAKRALTEHFERVGEKIELLTVPGDHWRIKHPLPDPAPLVSLIIPTRNALKLTKQAVDSVIEKTIYPNYEIIIVDNNSDDEATLAWFKEIDGKSVGRQLAGAPQTIVRVLPYPGIFNYSAINNFAVEHAKGEVIGLLNNDVEVINADWMDELVSQAIRPGIGAVGAMLYYPLNTVQHAGVILGLGGVAGHPFKEFPRNDQGQKNRLRLVQNYSAVTGACLFVRKDRFLEVGGLDAEKLAVAFNDVDLCCKFIAAGYRNLWTPFAELYHHESASRGIEDTDEKKKRFQSEIETMMNRWPELLANDPAYNPNLTLVGEDFSTAYLPRWKKPWLTATTV